ncbi:MAG: hypothetical protein LBD37_03475 [Treponema sp.]|jgi:hypothetical protein|nr:hypothetical protein [Treponema sp.]
MVYGGKDPSGRQSEFPGGLIIQAENPDGTEITPQRCLGANSPVNLIAPWKGQTILDSGKKALMRVAVSKDDRARSPFTRVFPVSFAHAVDPEAVTPSEIVIALNAAAQDLFTVEIDPATERVNLRGEAGARFISVSGFLAGALGFGDGTAWRSFGAPFFAMYGNDENISVTPTATRSEETRAALNGGSKNVPSSWVLPGKVTGWSIAVANRSVNELFNQAVNGGAFSVGESARGSLDIELPLHETPISNSGSGRTFTVHHITLKGTADSETNRNSPDGVTDRIYHGCTITQADDGTGALTVTTSNYTITAPGFVFDENGNKIPNPEKRMYARGDDKENHLAALTDMDSADAELKIGDIRSVRLLTVTHSQDSLTLVHGAVGRNAYTVSPPDAAGYAVTFNPLTTLTNTKISWDYANRRAVIEAGSVTGTETVTARFTNMDGTIVNDTFIVTVAAL